MVHECILLSCDTSFDPLLTKRRSLRLGPGLKCSERNWPMYSLLKVAGTSFHNKKIDQGQLNTFTRLNYIIIGYPKIGVISSLAVSMATLS